MNRSKAIALANEMSPAPGWTKALEEALKIPSEPEYLRCCDYCGDKVEEGQQCCHEIHNGIEARCPMCGDDVEWSNITTSCGIEASIPKCVHCDWEGDPQ